MLPTDIPSFLSRQARVLGIFALSGLVMSIGPLRGKWHEFTAPRLHAVDLANSPLNIEAQRQNLIEFEFKMCQVSGQCAKATLGGDADSIITACETSARLISALEVPITLPPTVQKNLSIYRQSMINSETLIADQWRERNFDGGRFWTFLKNWEIDGSGKNSVPQRIRRLYQLDQLTKTELVTCKEIEELHNRRAPASGESTR